MVALSLWLTAQAAEVVVGVDGKLESASSTTTLSGQGDCDDHMKFIERIIMNQVQTSQGAFKWKSYQKEPDVWAMTWYRTAIGHAKCYAPTFSEGWVQDPQQLQIRPLVALTQDPVDKFGQHLTLRHKGAVKGVCCQQKFAFTTTASDGSVATVTCEQNAMLVGFDEWPAKPAPYVTDRQGHFASMENGETVPLPISSRDDDKIDTFSFAAGATDNGSQEFLAHFVKTVNEKELHVAECQAEKRVDLVGAVAVSMGTGGSATFPIPDKGRFDGKAVETTQLTDKGETVIVQFRFKCGKTAAACGNRDDPRGQTKEKDLKISGWALGSGDKKAAAEQIDSFENPNWQTSSGKVIKWQIPPAVDRSAAGALTLLALWLA